ncbi:MULTISPECIES: hypothetical protein [Neorhizobium]|jgi:hypothetical protein|uniref:hypothetical protein n=1 Tax=Neorhizobium TaxID=1525371 RepID=UPI001044B208|nr:MULTISPECIES: hypothetical protein [Neorhizobium]
MNIPRIFVVWSARPIQPLKRSEVRPQGDGPGISAERSPVAKRINGCRVESRDKHLTHLARRHRITCAWTDDLHKHMFVRDHAI